MADCLKFHYLYRDAGNYKRWGIINFRNPDGVPVRFVCGALKNAFVEHAFFIAQQVRIPSLFLFSERYATSDDHCFHEFDMVERTNEPPDDSYSRSIVEFIEEIRRESKTGWVTFDPCEGFKTRLY